MPFKYSAFLSYRHSTQYKGGQYIEQISTELKAELELRVPQEVFRDTERLSGAEFYNEALGTAICQSVCMVVLFWPTYFSLEHPFCSREFRAMESLEAARLQMLPDPLERQKSLIIVVALREFNRIPERIRLARLCVDFEAHTLYRNMQKSRGFQNDILRISSYIADRCRALQNLNPDPCTDCSSFLLPGEQAIESWIHEMEHPGVPFANREIRA